MLPNQTEHSYKNEEDETTVIYSEVKKEEAIPEEVEGDATHEGKEERGYQREVEVKEGETTGIVQEEESTGRNEGVHEEETTGRDEGAKEEETTRRDEGVKEEEATGRDEGVKEEEATGGVKEEEATGRDEGVKEEEATGNKVEAGECKCMYKSIIDI